MTVQFPLLSMAYRRFLLSVCLVWALPMTMPWSVYGLGEELDQLPLLSAEEPRVAGLSGLELESILAGFSNLVAITHAGDGRLFLVEQGGEILILEGGSTATFLDLGALMGAGFEGGLKSIAFHPSYPDPGFFFVHYTDLAGEAFKVINRLEDRWT